MVLPAAAARLGARPSDELERILLLTTEFSNLLENCSIHREGQLGFGFENSLRFHLDGWCWAITA